MKELLFVVAIIVIGSLIILYGYIDSFIFYPPSASYRDTKEIIKLSTASGEKISAIYLPNPEAKYVVLVSHGNAEDLGTIYPFLLQFRANGFAVFAYDYAGYGTSSGKASIHNTYNDIDSAYAYISKQLHYPPQKIILFGRSLGAALAIDLASREPVGGLIIQSAFASVYRVITKVPLLPFDKYNNIAKLSRVRCPILVIHGTSDKIIPIWHGKEIYKVYSGKKKSYWVEGAGHNDLLQIAGKTYWYEINSFPGG